MSRRLAYLCLQATTQGQASYAHVHEIISGLREEGWEVDLYEPSYTGGAAPSALGRLLEFRRVQNRLLANLRGYDALYVRAHPLASRASSGARWSGVPSIQECNGPYEDLFLAWPAARPLRGWLTRIARAQYRDADALIAVTPQLANWLREQTGRADVDVVPNGANTDVFTPEAPHAPGLPQRYVVFFGALAPWQGILTCLAATGMSEWPDDVSLIVAGDGALRSAVESAVTNAPDRVRYLGSIAYREVAGVVAHSIASLVPMHQPERDDRGLAPLKLFESMACGVPVIASDLPGLTEVVTQADCGVMVPAGDVAALANAVAQVASDSSAAKTMGAHGRSYVTEYASWRARAAATSAIIERAVRESGQAAKRTDAV